MHKWLLFLGLLIVQPGKTEAQSLLWAKQLSGDANESIIDLCIGPLGNVYVTGSYEETVDFDPGPGVMNLTSASYSDIFFAKYDSVGALQYVRTVQGISYDESVCIAVDQNSNIYICGDYGSTTDFDPGPGVATLPMHGITDGFLAKYNIVGDFEWAIDIGSSGWDYVSAIEIMEDGNVLVCGFFSDSADFDPGPGTDIRVATDMMDMFLAKYSYSGNLMWAVTAGGTNDQWLNNAIEGDDGNIYACGTFFDSFDLDPGPGVSTITSNGVYDIFYAVYDGSGNFIKGTGMGGTGSDYGWDIAVDMAGTITLAGVYENTVDFDPGTDSLYLTAVGVYPDLFISKYDPAGTLVFAQSMGSIGIDHIGQMDVDPAGDIFITGHFPYSIDFDPGPDTFLLSSTPGGVDIYLAKYDGTTGDMVWAGSIGSTGMDKSYAISHDGAGSFYISGSFRETPDFDPWSGITYLTAAGYDDAFFAKYSDLITSAPSGIGTSTGILLYPNPAGESFSIIGDEPVNDITLWDATGKEVKKWSGADLRSKRFEVQDLPTGLYFARIVSLSGTKSQKILIR